jgi:hypothetical protein
MLVTTVREKGFGINIKTVIRTILCTMQLSASNCDELRYPFSTKYLLEKLVSVKNTVAERARKRGTRTDNFPGSVYCSELDSPVTTTQPKIKIMPKM